MHLTDIAERAPGKAAVIMSDSNVVTTFADLDVRSRRVACLLRKHGLGRADHVALLVDNRPEFFEIAWAAQRSGLYWTPVSCHLTDSEVAHVVADSGARVLFASEPFADLAGRVAAQSPSIEVSILVGGCREGFVDYGRVAGTGAPVSPSGEVEGTYFFYTSGTTGAPKGIEPEHSFPAFGTGLGIDHMMAAGFGVGPDSTYLCPAPLYHASPIGWSLGTQRNGGTVVLMPRFDPVECLRAIEQYRVTHAQFVPTMFVRLLALPKWQRDGFDLSSLQAVIHAGAPCPISVKQRMIDWFGPIITEFYAGSEGVGMTTITSSEWLDHRGSVGRPVLGTVHILDDDGTELNIGQIGTVYFEGGKAFRYHNDPCKTSRTFNDRGWATLGDLGYLDDEGYLYLADRRTDLIISGGVNIYPAEIEDALHTHPAVADVAVIGVPDAEMGQSVKAVIQPATGYSGGDGLRRELIEHCDTRLARFKHPRSIAFAAELPRLPTGKLLRRRVRDQFGTH